MKTRFLLCVSVISLLALGACAGPTATITTTVTIGPTGTVTNPSTTPPSSTSIPTVTATYTLPTTPSTPAAPLEFPDSGNIRIGGDGYFYFQRVYGYITQPTYYQGVIFSPHQGEPGVTTTAPVAYSIDVQFGDGEVENLLWVGLGFTDHVDISLTKHTQPRAGVLLAWHDVNSSLAQVMYLLVSED
jgi:hypothetical protein